MRKMLCIIVVILGCCFNLIGQHFNSVNDLYVNSHSDELMDSTKPVRYYKVERTVCKGHRAIPISRDMFLDVEDVTSSKLIMNPIRSKVKLTGTISYEYLYRSYLDTPFVQDDYMQHSITSNLVYTTGNGTPVKLNFRMRVSNSPFFKNNFEFGSSFTNKNLFQHIRNNLKKEGAGLVKSKRLDSLQGVYNALIQDLALIKPGGILKSSDHQKIVELREKKLREEISIAKNDELNPDSISSGQNSAIPVVGAGDSIANIKLSSRSQLYDRKLRSLKEVEKNIQQEKLKLNEKRKKFYQDVAGISDVRSLKQLSKEYELPDSLMHQSNNWLMHFDRIGLGRNWVDYSELTVKNMLVTGITVGADFSPWLFDITAGNINYGFRDFVLNNPNLPQQGLFAIRGGIGKRSGNKILLTYFTGKRALLNSYGNIEQLTEKISGIALEGQMQINSSTLVSLEFAKSTLPLNFQNNRENVKMFDFGIRSNEAYAVKLNTGIGRNFLLNGFYKRSGSNFQSFNLMPVNIQQEAWAVNAKQFILKKRISVEGGLKKNDFNNLTANVPLLSSVIFKTLMVNVRIPKYPYLSIGYYPASQLTLLDDRRVAESYYNTLSTIISHSFNVKKAFCSFSASYVKFFNGGSDSAFIYSNSESIGINQQVSFGKLTSQFGYGLSTQAGLKIVSLDKRIHYRAKSWLSFLLGLKRISEGGRYVKYGQISGFQLHLKKLGAIQFNYEKNFLPGRNRILLPVDFGRLIYSRSFK